jgi:hypothetical protein
VFNAISIDATAADVKRVMNAIKGLKKDDEPQDEED